MKSFSDLAPGLTILIILLTVSVPAQDLKYERFRNEQMLKMIIEDLRNNYYDPHFKGIDLDAKYKSSSEKIEKAVSLGQMSGTVAQFLADFDDSHLFFLPPGKQNKTEYGFDFLMVGDKCFVYKVEKDTNAKKQGLAVGDQIISVQGFTPTRENLWKMRYLFFTLRPLPELNVSVVKPDGKAADIAIAAKVREGKRITDLTDSIDLNKYFREREDDYYKETKQYYSDKLEGVFIWKMPGFSLDPTRVDDMMGKARKFPAIILDLRGNSGGRVD